MHHPFIHIYGSVQFFVQFSLFREVDRAMHQTHEVCVDRMLHRTLSIPVGGDEMLKKFLANVRETLKRWNNRDYAYLCEARDLADLEWRMRNIHQRPLWSSNPYFYVRGE